VSRRNPLRSPYVWAFFVGVIAITALRPFLRHEPEPPPVLGRLPAWELIDQDGRSFGSEDLAGTVYVANFFFTSCVAICPALMHSMARLQERYVKAGVEGIRQVSISVDPEVDTPAGPS
jgi:protein SCO1/2